MNLKMIKIRQVFQGDKIDNVPQAVDAEFSKHKLNIKPGARIALAVGSRGIANIAFIVKSVAENVVKMGGRPFIVPAMGSHGGATAEGQTEVLKSLGISEELLGYPVLSSMEVVELPQNQNQNRVFMDKFAYESDGVILINRIKPHTDYHGPYESGLMKMSVVGLGKHKQAIEIHRFGAEGLKDLIPNTAKEIMASSKILLGLAIVENANDETAMIKVMTPEQIIKEEPTILQYAKKNMPKLPVEDIDVLIVHKLGKNISGTGLDPNIIGRLKIQGQPEPESPRIKSIVLTDITPESHGNSVGIGFADVITKSLFQKIDLRAMYENVITSTFIERAKIPLMAENAKRALEIALKSCGFIKQGNERIVYISDTLHLNEMFVSTAVYKEIKDSVEIIEEDVEIFNQKDELVSI